MQVVDEAEDVAAEHQRVAELADFADHPIVVKELKKVYPGLDGQPPKVSPLGVTGSLGSLGTTTTEGA